MKKHFLLWRNIYGAEMSGDPSAIQHMENEYCAFFQGASKTETRQRLSDIREGLGKGREREREIKSRIARIDQRLGYADMANWSGGVSNG